MNDPAGLPGKRLLVINACTPAKAFAFKILNNLGIYTIVLNEERSPWIDDYVNEWIIADTHDHNGSLKAIQEYKDKGNSIDGVVSFWEDSVLLTSKISDMLGLIGIPYTISSVLKDKYQFKKRFGSEIYNKSLKLHDHDDVRKIKEMFGYPIVMKPAFGADSSLVIKVYNEEEALKTFDEMSSRVTYDENVWDGLDIIVEKYMDGVEVDIDILIQDGHIIYHTVTDNDPTNEPYFIETGKSAPSIHSNIVQEEIITVADKCVLDAGIKDGLIHMEAKYTSDTGAELLEANLRLGGCGAYAMNKYTRGVDLVENAAKIALGIPCHIDNYAKILTYQVCKYIAPQQSGILRKVTIPEDIQKSILELTLVKQPGDPVLLPPAGFDYIGWLIVDGKSFEEANSKMSELLKGIIINME